MKSHPYKPQTNIYELVLASSELIRKNRKTPERVKEVKKQRDYIGVEKEILKLLNR